MKKLQIVAVTIIALMLAISCQKDDMMNEVLSNQKREMRDTIPPTDSIPIDTGGCEDIVIYQECSTAAIIKEATGTTSIYLDSLTGQKVKHRNINVNAHLDYTFDYLNPCSKYVFNFSYKIYKRVGLQWSLKSTQTHTNTQGFNDNNTVIGAGNYKVIYYKSCNYGTTWSQIGYKYITLQ